MSLRRRVKRLGAVAVVTVLAGCSGDSDPLSADALRTQANAACRRTDSAVTQGLRALRSGTGVSITKAKSVVPDLSRAVHERTEALSDLQPPEDSEPRVEEMLRAMRTAGAAFDEAVDAADDGDEGILSHAIGEALGAWRDASLTQADMGFSGCAPSRLGFEPLPGLSSDQQEFVKRADATCHATREATAPLIDEFVAATLGRKANPLSNLVAAWKEQAAQLRSLSPPAGDEARIDTVFATYERSVTLAEAAVPLAQSGAQADFERAYAEFEDARMSARQRFAEVQMRTCAAA